MKILIDTNIVLDVLLKRHPFYQDSFVIFKLIEQQRINGFLSASCITDIFYLLKKSMKNSVDVYPIMDELTRLFTVAPVNETTVADALALRWKDFEDAIQFIVAKEGSIDFIITRNTVDYKIQDIPCMTPAEFIASFKEKT